MATDDKILSGKLRTLASAVSVKKTANQGVTLNVNTDITWDSEEFDTDGYHSNTINTTRITFPFACKFLTLAVIAYDLGVTGQVRLKLNGNIIARAISLGTEFISILRVINATAAGSK